MFPNKLQKNKGFTLIELLVVLSIISLLSSIVLAALNDARAKARDARREMDIRQIQTALELYRDDHGEYPWYPSSWACSYPYAGQESLKRWSTYLQKDLKPYISQLPNDPINSNDIAFVGSFNNVYGYCYYTLNNPASVTGMCPGKQSYILVYKLEKDKRTSIGPGITTCQARVDDGIVGPPFYSAGVNHIPYTKAGVKVVGVGK